MELFDINLAGIAFCAVMWVGLGSLWYSPLLFAQGSNEAAGDGQLGLTQVWILVAGMLGSCFVDVLLNAYEGVGGLLDWQTGAALGLLVWLGTAVPMRMIEFAYRRSSFDLFLIDSGNTALCYFFTGLLLGNWAASAN